MLPTSQLPGAWGIGENRVWYLATWYISIRANNGVYFRDVIFFPSKLMSFVCVFPMQEAFVELYDRQRDSVFSCSWPSIKTVFGMAALGAASLTIGAYLAQKWTASNILDVFLLLLFFFFYFPSSSASCLSSLLLRIPLTPSEKNLQISPSQSCSSSKGLFPPSALHVKTKRQKAAEAKWWTAERRTGLTWNRRRWSEEWFFIFFWFFSYFLVLPASVLV